MAKVVTVWGSPDSGKSIFCCILVKAPTRDKSEAILINVDISASMLPVWLLKQLVPANASIGQVLSSVEIDTVLATSHVAVLKSYLFIGLIGYCVDENPLSYSEMKYDMAMVLIAAAPRLVDFIILGCSSATMNAFAPVAIESGDLVIQILTPDLKGIHYLKAYQPLLADSRFRYHGHLTFAGLVRPFHVIEEMGHLIGGLDGLLPYGKEVDRCATEGGTFRTISYCNSKYMASLSKALEVLEPKEEERQQDDFVEERQEERADE